MIDECSGFAIYRLPNHRRCTLVMQRGEIERVETLQMLDEKDGFVVAPFALDDTTPLLLIRPDVTSHIDLSSDKAFSLPPMTFRHHDSSDLGDDRNSYNHTFRLFHDQLLRKSFEKIVLARTSFRTSGIVPDNKEVTATFVRTCLTHPQLFVALVSTPISGTWLVATPEILLRGCDGRYQTIALAGTMHVATDDGLVWSDKNKDEQRMVAAYISSCLRRQGCVYREDGPYTFRAAHLVHLRTDFYFEQPDATRLGSLLGELHPTPAVCGLPKQAARQFIMAHEPVSRRYFSGFIGPLAPHGETHLYVTLRCMEITDSGFLLHAGGGLLPESEVGSEWEETEDKMQTISQCTAINEM